MNPIKLFVYGTLKRGWYNHHRLLTNSRFIGEATIKGKIYSMGGFPALKFLDNLKMENPPLVKGEVFEVDVVKDLPQIDRLEGHPNWYLRTFAVSSLGEVQVYKYLPDNVGPLIESGEWTHERPTRGDVFANE